MDQNWFEMGEIRRRRPEQAVWIPLRSSEEIEQEGKYGYIGYKRDFFGACSVAIPINMRDAANELRWNNIGLIHNQGVWATKDYYKSVDVYQQTDRVNLGVELVLVQFFETDDHSEWHLNQDIVFALGLKREGDVWVRPSEGYCTVAQIRRNIDGRVIAIEIKNEFLREYLAARSMILRMVTYQIREEILADASHIKWKEVIETQPERFEARVATIIEGGHPADNSSFAVFKISRTDVDPGEDVPVFGPETEENTKSESHQGVYTGKHLFRVMGELWREIIIEPGVHSVRIRGDKVPTGVYYTVDAGGTRIPSEELEDVDNARWLWFQPDVVLALLRYRGSGLRWYTQETGGVGCSTSRTHFGINTVNLINVYAPDIAQLPAWEQRVWASFNVTPEGKVSRELLSAQMEVEPARTVSPERALPEILEAIDAACLSLNGSPLFRSHPATSGLISAIHRFRALENDGILSLAKDLMRLTADRIDVVPLQKTAPPPKGEKWGSLKSLEKYLATLVTPEQARTVMGPLAGAYDLRVADAHLPKNEIEDAYRLARVDPHDAPLKQGFFLTASVAAALADIEMILRRATICSEGC
jgi:hypothetical protein